MVSPKKGRRALRFPDEASMRAALRYAGPLPVDQVPAKPSKYHASKTYVDGIKFDSKLEAKRYTQLKTMRAAGEIDYFLRQVPIILPSGMRLIVDFMIVPFNAPPRWEDVKGIETTAFRIKRREVKHHFPSITIELVTRC